MSDLLERRFVLCPYNLAQRYLAQVGARAGAAGPLALTLALPGAELVKEAGVTYDPAVDPMHFDQPWHVHWTPEAGPYPDFDGELEARYAADEKAKGETPS